MNKKKRIELLELQIERLCNIWYDNIGLNRTNKDLKNEIEVIKTYLKIKTVRIKEHLIVTKGE